MLLVCSTVLSGCMSSETSTVSQTQISSFKQCSASGGEIVKGEPLQCLIGGNMFVDEALPVTILKAQPEKDGYTLTVKDMTGKTYQSVVSIANLGPDSSFDFDHIQVGNQLKLKGKFWDMAGVPQITATYAEYIKGHDGASDAHCPLVDAKNLNLWINAQPGLGGPTLIAIFKATTPTPGYRFKGEVIEIMETDPPSYVIDVIAVHPSEAYQVETPTEVRLDIPVESEKASMVTFICNGRILFKADQITTAY